MSSELGGIQQRARVVSRELQKVKTTVMKNVSRSYGDKAELLGLIVPCEVAARELLALSEVLTEYDSSYWSDRSR